MKPSHKLATQTFSTKASDKSDAIASIEYLTRIRNHYDTFNSSEKRIADYILQHSEAVPEMSAQALAKAAETSPATIIRFCRAIGFKGYTELKYYIEREFLTPGTDSFQIKRGESVKVIKQKLFHFNQSVLDETMMILNDDDLQKAVDLIGSARKIDIYGEGGSGSVAQSAAYILMQMGLQCTCYNDAWLQITAASQLHHGDVAIAIAHSGRVHNTVDASRMAKEQGAKVIGITGYPNTPLTEHLDVVLFTSSRESNVLSDLPAARLSELCVISVIQMALLSENYESYANQIEKAKEAFRRKRAQLS